MKVTGQMEDRKELNSLNKEILTIICGVIMGTLARYRMLRRDFRQYPSIRMLVNIWLWLCGGHPGAVAIPAISQIVYCGNL